MIGEQYFHNHLSRRPLIIPPKIQVPVAEVMMQKDVPYLEVHLNHCDLYLKSSKVAAFLVPDSLFVFQQRASLLSCRDTTNLKG